MLWIDLLQNSAENKKKNANKLLSQSASSDYPDSNCVSNIYKTKSFQLRAKFSKVQDVCRQLD